jgi:uncharacterized Zn finger protein (UPF0148 family)
MLDKCHWQLTWFKDNYGNALYEPSCLKDKEVYYPMFDHYVYCPVCGKEVEKKDAG